MSYLKDDVVFNSRTLSRTQRLLSKPWKMRCSFLGILLFSLALACCGETFNESLSFKPLLKNALLADFEFLTNSSKVPMKPYSNHTVYSDHYSMFPRDLVPLIEHSATRSLHLRFAQGWWDSETWGRLPRNGSKSGGTGVEVWGIIEAPHSAKAMENWLALTESLSGFFCASLNYIDESITTVPKYWANGAGRTSFVLNTSNNLYYLRASLPAEPICTENLTPFTKLLPSRGKAGLSSLLDGHKIFDTLWHSMSIDLETVCDESQLLCHLAMDQSVMAVIDVLKAERTRRFGNIPKPTPGDELCCDPSKKHDIWCCFPCDDPGVISWDLETIFGRKLLGPALESVDVNTSVFFDVDFNLWNVSISKDVEDENKTTNIVIAENASRYDVIDQGKYNFQVSSFNSSATYNPDRPDIHAARSLTGYSQDGGGFRVVITNPSENNEINFVYFESLPWFMRLYLSTLKANVRTPTYTYDIDKADSSIINSIYYKPAVDRKRSSQLEFSLTLPPKLTITLTYQFDKSLLLYGEYPPDANHGFSIEPALITVFDDNLKVIYELRTTSLLLSLPTPDFSMPYNVIIFTFTVLSLAFGSVFNLLTKKVVTEEELESLNTQSKSNKLFGRIKAFFIKEGKSKKLSHSERERLLNQS